MATPIVCTMGAEESEQNGEIATSLPQRRGARTHGDACQRKQSDVLLKANK